MFKKCKCVCKKEKKMKNKYRIFNKYILSKNFQINYTTYFIERIAETYNNNNANVLHIHMCVRNTKI